jgi:hypothetical protein
MIKKVFRDLLIYFLEKKIRNNKESKNASILTE